MSNTILEVRNLVKNYPVRGGFWNRAINTVKAVSNVELQLTEGQTLGLVGESGCGKSTLGKVIIRLEEPTNGSIIFDNYDLTNLSKKELRNCRKDFQMIFQDPFGSLNPKLTVFQLLAEPLQLHEKLDKEEIINKVHEIMNDVGLSTDQSDRYPHEFSGGQRQRISIGRALATNPKLIICDEPVSALDVSIQAQIINLLMDLQQKYRLTYLFISHDLTIVRHISHHIAVMYLGKIVEYGSNEEIYNNPSHPYTQALLSAVPTVHKGDRKDRILLEGDVPSPIDPPIGCAFHPRCRLAEDICKQEIPSLRTIANTHLVACHRTNN